jgi:hypothetical protein
LDFADLEKKSSLADGETRESSLEAYATAVRVYQSIVLELQDVSSQDPAIQGTILERAAVAKETVDYYEVLIRRPEPGPGIPVIQRV